MGVLKSQSVIDSCQEKYVTNSCYVISLPSVNQSLTSTPRSHSSCVYVYIPEPKPIVVSTAEINSISLKNVLFPTIVDLQIKLGYLKNSLFILKLPTLLCT